MLSCLQVNITRMDQQKWKRELDDEARRKEKEEDDKENAHQNKPKGEGKAKTKPKSKAKKSPKEKDTKKDPKKDAKPTPTAKSAKAKAKPKTKPEPPPADAEAEMKTPVRKHVPKGPSPTGLQKRKSAAALEPGDHVTPPRNPTAGNGAQVKFPRPLPVVTSQAHLGVASNGKHCVPFSSPSFPFGSRAFPSMRQGLEI